MSLEDKFENAVERKVTGDKEREAEGKVTGDKTRESEGKAQGVLGKVKETFSDAKEEVKEKFEDLKK